MKSVRENGAICIPSKFVVRNTTFLISAVTAARLPWVVSNAKVRPTNVSPCLARCTEEHKNGQPNPTHISGRVGGIENILTQNYCKGSVPGRDKTKEKKRPIFNIKLGNSQIMGKNLHQSVNKLGSKEPILMKINPMLIICVTTWMTACGWLGARVSTDPGVFFIIESLDHQIIW